MLPYDCLHSTDVLCTNYKHIESVQLLHDNIISATMEASENIPTTNSKNHKIPGWTKAVQIYKEADLFWSIWLSNYSPRQGVVADVMRKTRAKYHYAIRQVKIRNYIIKSNLWLEQLPSTILVIYGLKQERLEKTFSISKLHL